MDRPCICGCGNTPIEKSSRYLPGHDAVAMKKVRAFLEEHGLADVEELFERYSPAAAVAPSEKTS